MSVIRPKIKRETAKFKENVWQLTSKLLRRRALAATLNSVQRVCSNGAGIELYCMRTACNEMYRQG